MKKILSLFLLLIVSAFPQESRYLDAPFGGGGGYSPGWFIPKLDPINSELKIFGISDLSTSGFFTSGGAGFIYLGFVPGLRIGGMGYSGSTSEEVTNKEVIYTLGGGGLTVEYSLPFIRDVGISVGAIIGGGSLQIEVYQNSNNYNWNDIWAPGASSGDVSRTITNNFWIFSPTLNIDIPFYRFLNFRIGGGYQVSLGDSWTLDNDRELAGIPSDLNGNSFFIQTGIFIGFFSF